MKSCQVYKTKKEYIVVTKSKTESWILVEDDPVFRVPINDKAELYKVVYKVLAGSRENIPDIPREEMSSRSKEILKKMGQESYAKLYRTSNTCSIEIDERDNVIISPYHFRVPGKYSGGLETVSEDVVEMHSPLQEPNDFLDVLIEVLNKDYKK